MKTYLVVTITCPDRPGIVERVTEVMVEFSANWEESRLARLGGDFAGIIKLSVPPEKAEALAQSLRALADDQLGVLVKTTQSLAADPLAGYALYELRLVGADHEGIVHRVASYLASQGINVENLETEMVLAPMSAAPLFQMQAQIKVPPGLPLTELGANLDRIGDELGVDIEVHRCTG
ncbi:MAG: glycine cleavage system protein R [Planctomycetota bacterium]|nr:glycine cleavage system protein R [Planctomycetota bacterium]